MRDFATTELLACFLTELRAIVPVEALWAHGSLGAGDYVAGRSDLDLVAVVGEEITPDAERRIAGVHQGLAGFSPLVPLLHCAYLTAGEAADAERQHATWAYEELFRRPVTPVARRELLTCARVLYGRAPQEVLPPVSDRQLRAYVLRDLGGYWRPALDHAELWLRDVWVDLGLLTLARGGVTLREGRMITKREALEVLPALGAPAEVVEDVRRRRYEGAGAGLDPAWRADAVRAFLAGAIDRTVAGAGA
ncbi:nucleotidyltransferase [Streptomyces sp. NPDC060194]|uniref:nucleotidyltransferase n=1 Tax=Streptomyces sp. NPDC060194 TaxID=3347069 RepID=UPI003665D990